MDLQRSGKFNNLKKSINFNSVIDIYSKTKFTFLNIMLEKLSVGLIFGRN